MSALDIVITGVVLGLVLIVGIVVRMYLDHGMHPTEWLREWRQWPQDRPGLVVLIVFILILGICAAFIRFGHRMW